MATTWVYRKPVMSTLGTGRKGFETIVRSGRIRSRVLAGMTRRQYALEDAIKLVAEAEGGGGGDEPLAALAAASPAPEGGAS
jgi:hypothetical protein